VVTDFSAGVQVVGMFQTERFISVIESADEFKALHKYSRTQFAIFFRKQTPVWFSEIYISLMK
jgi:hypothetical protein